MNDKNFKRLYELSDDLELVRNQISDLGQDLFYHDDVSDLDLDRIEWVLDELDRAQAHLITLKVAAEGQSVEETK